MNPWRRGCEPCRYLRKDFTGRRKSRCGSEVPSAFKEQQGGQTAGFVQGRGTTEGDGGASTRGVEVRRTSKPF